MQSRKTPYGWMALGGMLCLLGLGIACKMREGNLAQAQAEPPVMPPAVDTEKVVPVPMVPSGDVKPSPINLDFGFPVVPTEVPDAPPPARVGRIILHPPSQTIPLPPPNVTPTSGGVIPATFQDATPSTLPVPYGSTLPPLPPVSAPTPTPITQPAGWTNPVPTPTQDLGAIVIPPVLVKKETPAVPTAAITPVRAEAKPSEPGEPPLAPAPGPVQMYQVRLAQESLRDIARRTLGDAERWGEIYKLNPSLKPEMALLNGTVVRLPADACLPLEEVTDVKPLPLLRPDLAPAKVKILMPLTGTYPCNLDEKHVITLPRAMRDQIGDGEIVMVSPGPDHCLWVTTQDHLERLAKRLEASPAREHEVRSFRRLYFAQTEKLTLTSEGRIQIPDRLTQFAGLHQEVVLIGIDDHFELWDVVRWRQYTQAKSAAARSAMSDD